ncbi:hypothetical protein [Wolbachia endosymbiont of Carposina sasakii]|uniref:hypothetical protein n=1 Tax=Wolbachia endosymbiont of Carposina sasakii TaxID=2591635 RepID=UPI00142E8B1C|nr:hypothetical protein [Wolbachia endosymbiont of Carposina sasakii]
MQQSHHSQGTGMTKKGGTGTTKWSVCFCHPMIAKKTWSRAGMTPKGLLPSWMETSVSYLEPVLKGTKQLI